MTFSSVLLFLSGVVLELLCLRTSLVEALPWSRSLPNGTLSGFPIDVAHLVVAQGAQNFTLFAFEISSGTPMWTIRMNEPLFPYALYFEGVSAEGGSPLKVNIGIFQGHASMYGIDMDHGIVKWSLSGLSSDPVFLPTPMATGPVDGVLTSVRVNSSFPRCLGGVDVSTGRTLWVDCTHTLYAGTAEDGAPLPVVVTEKTFFGCFESDRDPHRSMVLERQLDDPVFPPHVFDFFPLTVIMTNSIGFLTANGNSATVRGGHKVHRERDHQDKGGLPIRVAFAISAWDSLNLAYTGATTVVSVIAQAGMISWKKYLPSALNSPVSFFIREDPEVHLMVVSDGLSFILALATDSGWVLWNQTVNRTANGSASGAVELSPITHVLQTHHHVFFSQHISPAVATPHNTMAAPSTDVVAVLDLLSGKFVNDALIVSSISSQFASHHDILYIPSSFEVVVLNVTNMAMRSLYLTHSPVSPLFDADDDDRLVFGTASAVYSFPLL